MPEKQLASNITSVKFPKSVGILNVDITTEYYHHNGETPFEITPSLVANICEHVHTEPSPIIINAESRDTVASLLNNLGLREPISTKIASALPERSTVAVFGALTHRESLSIVVAIPNDRSRYQILFSRNAS